MAEKTAITWCDATWNPWIGCQDTGSPACAGCYARNLMGTQGTRYKRVKWGGPHIGAGDRIRTAASSWSLPRRLEKQALREGRILFCFCASLADIFDPAVDRQWLRDAFDEMRATPHVIYLLLTKRPHLITRLAAEAGGLPPNVALGTTVVTQEEAEDMVPELLDAAAALKPKFTFLSLEPLVAPVNLTALSDVTIGNVPTYMDVLRGKIWAPTGSWPQPKDPATIDGDRQYVSLCCSVDWVITGGGTDQGTWKAAPSNPQWFRDVRDACSAAGVAYHHKQNGEWRPAPDIIGASEGGMFHRWPDGSWSEKYGKAAAGRLLDGRTHDARPQVAYA